jgi:hypothetical protein
MDFCRKNKNLFLDAKPEDRFGPIGTWRLHDSPKIMLEPPGRDRNLFQVPLIVPTLQPSVILDHNHRQNIVGIVNPAIVSDHSHL